MRALWITGVLSLAASAAWAENNAQQLIGDVSPADGRPRPTFVIDDRVPVQPLPPPPGGDFEAHAAPKIFYMNKNGGTYVPGTNDARTNRSTIPDSTSVVAPWNVSAAGWQSVMTCMTTMFSRWNVQITDVDPGNVPHWEIVVAGRPQDVGMPSGVGGVSPFSCGTINNSIVFTFAVVYGTAYRDICETSAQEIAHSFGLDHEHMCSDPMTYLTGCGNKSFQNVAAPCGEYSNRACMCGGNTQNSVALLDQRLGLYEPPPAVDAGVDAPMLPTDAPPPPPVDAPQPPPVDAPDPVDPSDAPENPSADPDAGLGPSDEITGGCGCRTQGAPSGSLLALLLVVAGVILRRRKVDRGSANTRRA